MQREGHLSEIVGGGVPNLLSPTSKQQHKLISEGGGAGSLCAFPEPDGKTGADKSLVIRWF